MTRSAMGLVAVMAAAPLAAQPPAVLDSAFARFDAGPRQPAVAIAVVHRGVVVYRREAGFADLEHGVRASAETRYDWASIAKQVTAFSISLLVDQGRIDPTAPARRYLPELDLGGTPVSIDQLLHHTAGLEDSDGLQALAGGRPGDPVSLEAATRLTVRQRHLRSAPGEQHFYSNGGYLLLAAMVERLTGVSFARWTDSAVFQPLGMTRSGFLATPTAMVPGRARPYRPDPGTLGFANSVVEATPGPGGLYATIDDMARWARFLMKPDRHRQAALRLRTRGRLTSGDTLGYAWGLGWGTYRGRATLSHSGSGPATNAFLLTFPDLDFAVVAASASDTDPAISALAFRAADHFLRDQLGPVPAPPAAGPRAVFITDEAARARPPESTGLVVSAADRARFPGTYRMADSTTFVIRAGSDGLEYSWGGRRPYFPLFPLPDGRLVRVPLWDAFRFLVDSGGRVTGVALERTPKSLRRGGAERIEGVRIEERRFDASTAEPYLGLYHSRELEATYAVGLRDGRLELRHPRHGAMPLIPLGDDRFGVDAELIASARFGRVGGKVVGLELEAVSWGAKATFSRIADAPPR